jgi:NAD+ kinase
MTATNVEGSTTQHLAFNEVSLLRMTRQAANIRVHIDGIVRVDPVCRLSARAVGK